MTGSADGADSERPLAGRGRVFNVPTSEPFLPALVRAILMGGLPSPDCPVPTPQALTDYTILLPTRRAVRALQEEFLRQSDGSAMLLPHIRAIAEVNENLSLIDALRLQPGSADPIDVPPAVGELERHIVLTSLVMRWAAAMKNAARSADVGSDDQLFVAAGIQTAAQAAGLARELASLMDMVETENVSLARLDGLVPEDFSEHWKRTLKFLEIVLVMWPAYLEERKRLSPAVRRNELITAEAQRLVRWHQGGPIIVAGVTGSIPATGELMRVVAGLENGAIVLPGLDPWLDRESWDVISQSHQTGDTGSAQTVEHSEHPQFGLKKLLGAIGVAREDVALLAGCSLATLRARRTAFVSETMRPAMTTQKWHAYVASANQAEIGSALQGISLIESATEGEEAEVVSLILRSALETPGQTAALVTRNRLLARRVAVRLETWGIRVDDSAGRPFAKTLPGTFLDLVIEAVSHGFAPVPLMALLKHPLTRMALPAGDMRRAARALELAAFRTIYLGRGIEGVRNALVLARDSDDRHRAMWRVREEDLAAAFELVEALDRSFSPLVELRRQGGRCSLKALVEAHVRAAELVAAAQPVEPGGGSSAASSLWDGEAGETAQLIISGLLAGDVPDLDIPFQDYADFYHSLAMCEVVRSRIPVHPRIAIWGPFEARLQQPDIVILGGLNEGSWPEATDPGPWLNRPMRQTLGLPQPEERIGYSCHDFTSLFGAKEVHLTRALKVDGAPAVPSRWLLRIKALVDGLGLGQVLEPDRPWLGWAANRSATGVREAVVKPAPCPPIAVRPLTLSVSDVEQWMQNPYGIFASKILNLEPLARLGGSPNAALRGSLVHSVMSEFVVRHGVQLPDDPGSELLAIAREILGGWTHDDRIAAFWVPRFERFAVWFAETEHDRRSQTGDLRAEVEGKLVLDCPAGPFTLKARADRIDVTPQGLVITDYKTMSVGGLQGLARRAAAGKAPQLPLEALIAEEGGFAGLQEKRVAAIAYISASGAEPPGAAVSVDAAVLRPVVDDARRGLVALIRKFYEEGAPYVALRRPGFRYDFDAYGGLARIKEWSVAEYEGDD